MESQHIDIHRYMYVSKHRFDYIHVPQVKHFQMISALTTSLFLRKHLVCVVYVGTTRLLVIGTVLHLIGS